MTGRPERYDPLSNSITLPETQGQRIRRYRKRAGMLQRELAEKLGVDRTYVTQLETRPDMYIGEEMVKRCAIAIGVPFSRMHLKKMEVALRQILNTKMDTETKEKVSEFLWDIKSWLDENKKMIERRIEQQRKIRHQKLVVRYVLRRICANHATDGRRVSNGVGVQPWQLIRLKRFQGSYLEYQEEFDQLFKEHWNNRSKRVYAVNAELKLKYQQRESRAR